MSAASLVELFGPEWQPTPVKYDMVDGDVVFFEQLFDRTEADAFFQTLHTTTQWQQDKISVHGQSYNLPRLTAWYGDAGKTYTYSGIAMQPHAWTPTLLQIKARIEQKADVEFSSVLLNLYRTGQDSVNWHSDDEKELGKNPVIGSVSFGGTRGFQMRHTTRKDIPHVSIPLSHGSFLLMRGTTQHHWEHQIPKTTRTVEPRINLTFRVIT